MSTKIKQYFEVQKVVMLILPIQKFSKTVSTYQPDDLKRLKTKKVSYRV
jgi:hypothetical protein